MSESRSLQMDARRSAEPDDIGAGTLQNAWRLSKREISRGYISYLSTVLTTMLLGLILGLQIFDLLYHWGSDSAQASSLNPSVRMMDFFFLIIVSLLAVNWFAEGWSTPWRDTFSKNYTFLRTLPIGSKVLIASRILTTLLTLLPLSTVFFVTAYLFANSFGTGSYSNAVESQISVIQYFWFAIFWTAFGLVGGGFHLYMESGVRGKSILAVQLAWYLPLLFLVLAVSPAVGGIVAGTLRLVQQYGPIPAILATFVAGPLFLLWGIAAKRRLEGRDLAS